MSAEREPLSADQKRFLAVDAFIETVLEGRKQKEPTGSFWRFLLESSGGTALITVVLGGIATAIVTAIFQSWQKDRDLEHRIGELYGEYVIEQQKENLQAGLALRKDVFVLLGQISSKTTSIIDIAGPAFAKRGNKQEDAELQRQMVGIRADFNAIWAQWEASKQANGSMINFYFGAEANAAWNELSAAIDKSFACTSDFSMQPAATECKAESEAMRSATARLSDVFLRTPVATPMIDATFVDGIRKALVPTEK